MGFPRRMDRLQLFEQEACRASVMLLLDCPKNVREARLLERGKVSSHRQDDDIGTIKKRFDIFNRTTKAVIDIFKTDERLVVVDGSGSVDSVYEMMKQSLERFLDASVK